MSLLLLAGGSIPWWGPFIKTHYSCDLLRIPISSFIYKASLGGIMVDYCLDLPHIRNTACCATDYAAGNIYGSYNRRL